MLLLRHTGRGSLLPTTHPLANDDADAPPPAHRSRRLADDRMRFETRSWRFVDGLVDKLREKLSDPQLVHDEVDNAMREKSKREKAAADKRARRKGTRGGVAVGAETIVGGAAAGGTVARAAAVGGTAVPGMIAGSEGGVATTSAAQTAEVHAPPSPLSVGGASAAAVRTPTPLARSFTTTSSHLAPTSSPTPPPSRSLTSPANVSMPRSLSTSPAVVSSESSTAQDSTPRARPSPRLSISRLLSLNRAAPSPRAALRASPRDAPSRLFERVWGGEEGSQGGHTLI
jgi:hypothetical protein